MKKTKVILGDRLSAEMMYPLIELWLTSDRTQGSICEEYEIKPHTFSYWRSKYKKEMSAKTEAKSEKRFIPIQMDEHNDINGDYYAEIEYKNGTRLRFGQAVEVQVLQQLIAANGPL